MEQVRPTMEALVDRVGAGRLTWGTDIPHGDEVLHLPPEP